jgi:hypothetical protein
LERDLLPLKEAAQKAGFLVVVSIIGKDGSETDSIGLVENIYRGDRVETIARARYTPIRGPVDIGKTRSLIVDQVNATSGGFLLDSLEDALNHKFLAKLLRETYEVSIVDPVPNRAAHLPAGLFSFLKNHLKSNPIQTPFTLYPISDKK